MRKTYITVFSRIESAVQSCRTNECEHCIIREESVTQVEEEEKTYEEQEAAHLTAAKYPVKLCLFLVGSFEAGWCIFLPKNQVHVNSDL